MGLPASLLDGAAGKPRKPGKYKAKPTVYKGCRYDSKSEARHAQLLDLAKQAGRVRWWLRQVPIQLGNPEADRPYRVDFVVCEADGTVVAHEVKGMETPQFKRQKRQWAIDGPFALHVIKGKKVEIVEGGGA